MTKEEALLNLHLLQQEYDKLKSDYDKAGDALEASVKYLSEEMAEHVAVKKEYDKLKGEKSFQVEINLGLHKEIIELKKEHATLKDKADKMESLLTSISNHQPVQGRVGCTWGDTEYDSMSAAAGYNEAIENMASRVRKFLSSYNSNTNQKDNK